MSNNKKEDSTTVTLERYEVLRDFNTGEKGFAKGETISVDQTSEYQLRWLQIDGYVAKAVIA